MTILTMFDFVSNLYKFYIDFISNQFIFMYKIYLKFVYSCFILIIII